MIDITNLDSYQKKSTRQGFGEALVELSENPNIWAVSADLSESMMLKDFASNAPQRFLECGIAEQNAVTIASGLSIANPENSIFFATFANFASTRCLDQIRISVCQQNCNVKIIGGHSGLSYGEDGITIQTFEDIAIMRSLANMRVYLPSTAKESYEMTKEIANTKGPCYMRLNREPDLELFQNENKKDFTGVIYNSSLSKSWDDKILIFSFGYMLGESMKAAIEFEKLGHFVTVYNLSKLKPLNQRAIADLIRLHDKIITAEEHNIYGGIGSVISEIIAQYVPGKILKIVGIKDTFGQTGSSQELREYYGMNYKNIISTLF